MFSDYSRNLVFLSKLASKMCFMDNATVLNSDILLYASQVLYYYT